MTTHGSLYRLFAKLTTVGIVIIMIWLTVQRVPYVHSQGGGENATPESTIPVPPNQRDTTENLPPTSQPPQSPPAAPITIQTATEIFFENAEQFIADRWTINQHWRQRTTGQAHSGSGIFALTGADNQSYPAGASATLSLNEPLNLPGNARTTLSYWQRAHIAAGDSATVQVSLDQQTWMPVRHHHAQTNRGWTFQLVDLSSYAGHPIFLRFVFNADTDIVSVGQGWYLDDVRVFAEPTPIASLSELTGLASDAARLWINEGSWLSVAQPVHSGLSAWQTVTQPETATALTLNIDVDLSTQQAPQLSFVQRLALQGTDKADIQLSLDSGLNWNTLATFTAAQNSADWTTQQFDLSVYQGRRVRVRFLVTATSVNPVSIWALDNIAIQSDVLNPPPSPEDSPLGCQKNNPDRLDCSSLDVSGVCDAFGIAVFTITNYGEPGEGDMVAPTEYRLLKDEQIIETGDILLPGGQSMQVTYADGGEVRLEADQQVGHPGNSHPLATLTCRGSEYTLTPTILDHINLQLTSMCSENPDLTRRWRVHNSNPSDVNFLWQVTGGGSGNETAPANSDYFFETTAVPGSNTMMIFVDGIQNDVKASSGDACTPPTATSSATAILSATATPTDVPPTVTHTDMPTEIPPSVTDTEVPPTASDTATPLPPTDTNVPQATETSVPPTESPESLPTNTATEVPPTVTPSQEPSTATATPSPTSEPKLPNVPQQIVPDPDPNPQSPANSTQSCNRLPTFTWTVGDRTFVIRYRFQLYTLNEDGTKNILINQNVDHIPGNFTHSYTVTTPLTAEDYYWRVRAHTYTVEDGNRWHPFSESFLYVLKGPSLDLYTQPLPGLTSNVVGNTQPLTAQVLDCTGTPMTGETVEITITGANPTGGTPYAALTGNTGAPGIAEFQTQYVGQNAGTDSIRASVTTNQYGETAGGVIEVFTWLVPTNTPTNTPTATSTPTNTPTSTPTNTPTFTPTATFTPTNTPTTALDASAQCVGDDLEITIVAGDGPFDITMDRDPGGNLPFDDVPVGAYTSMGPGTWINVQVVEQANDFETVSLGDFTCALPTLILAPEIDGPNPLEAKQTLTATLLDANGQLMDSEDVTISVTGANTHTATETTTSGVATFTYPDPFTTANVGKDTVIATANINGQTITSNTAEIYWIDPIADVSMLTVWGSFYDVQRSTCNAIVCAAKESLPFYTQPEDAPVFDQEFPALIFNPPGSIPITGLDGEYRVDWNDDNTRVETFTNIVIETQEDTQGNLTNNFMGTLPASGNGFIAGPDSNPSDNDDELDSFEAVLTGEIVAASEGLKEFTVHYDDAVGIGIGGVSPPSVIVIDHYDEDWDEVCQTVPVPENTPFYGFPTFLWDFCDTGDDFETNTFEVYFPAPGRYPFEVNFRHVGYETVGLVWAINDSIAIPPVGRLEIVANHTVDPQTGLIELDTGENGNFTVTAYDPQGALMQEANIELIVDGANSQSIRVQDGSPQDLDQTVNGSVTFEYKGYNAGLDGIQAITWLDAGMTIYSAQVVVNWQTDPQNPPDPPTSNYGLATPGCLELPNPHAGVPEEIDVTQQILTGRETLVLKSGYDLESKASLSLFYYPVDDPTATTDIESTMLFDSTLLANGSYIIEAHCVTPEYSGSTLLEPGQSRYYSAIMVTVVGENKPGRVKFTIEDFTVPVAGLPIEIGRTYDSLERQHDGDFGYGWSLSLANTDLEIDPLGNVTMTMPGGERRTFLFRPEPPAPIFGFLLTPKYQSPPGEFGTLEADGCGSLVMASGQPFCFPGNRYQDSVDGYTYTDPYGRQYIFEKEDDVGKFTLRRIEDLNDNVLTFSYTSVSGDDPLESITSNNGQLSVQIARDGDGRISTITETEDNVYEYAYTNRELTTVTYPSFDDEAGNPQAVVTQYTYTADHFIDTINDPASAEIVMLEYYDDPADLSTECSNAGYVFADNDQRLFRETRSVSYPAGMTNKTYVTDYCYKIDDATGLTETKVINRQSGVVEGEATTTRNDMGYVTKEEVRVDASTIRTTTYEYDNARWVDLQTKTDIEIFDNSGVEWEDRNYNLTTVTQASGTVDESRFVYVFDENGNRDGYSNDEYYLTATDTFDPIVVMSYNEYGGPNDISTMSPNPGQSCGDCTYTMNYDARFNPIGVSDAFGLLGQYTFTAAGTLDTKTVTVNGVAEVLDLNYDPYGNVIERINPEGHTTLYEYDTFGRMTRRENAELEVSTYTYDDLGRVTTMTNPQEGTTKYYYDVNGNVITLINANGIRTDFDYAGENMLVKSTDSNLKTREYDYDFRGNLISEKDELGWTTTYEYNMAGDLITVTRPDSSVVEYDYDAAGRVTHKIVHNEDWNSNAFDVVIKYEYDNAGRIYREIYNPDGTAGDVFTVTYEYNAFDQITKVFDTYGSITEYLYDSRLRLTNVKEYPAVPGSYEACTSYAYDNADRVTHEQLHGDRDCVGAVEYQADYTYDKVGQLIGVDEDGDLQDTYAYTYDGIGRVLTYTQIRSTSPLVQDVTQYEYGFDPLDPSLAYVQVTDPESNVTTYFYNKLDQLVEIEAPDDEGFARSTVYEYDYAGRLEYTNHPDGTYNQNLYLDNGLLSTYRDENGLETNYDYDQLGRVIEVRNPLSESVFYEYDSLDNTIRVSTHHTRDVGGTPTTFIRDTLFEYDELNRLTKKIWPGAGAESTHRFETWIYDLAANTVTHQLPRDPGDPIEANVYDYDPFNFLVGETLQSGESYTYTYNTFGLRESVTDARGVTDYAYNALGQLTQVVYPDEQVPGKRYQLDYTYDLVGNQTSMEVGTTDLITNPIERFEYQHNGNNQVQQIIRKDTADEMTDFTFNPLGLPETITYPNGNIETYDYDDQRGFLDSMTLMDGTDERAHFIYQHDDVGNRTQIAQFVDYGITAQEYVIDYTYDDAYRLTSESRSLNSQTEWSAVYGYDDVGNRISETITIPGTQTLNTFTYDDYLDQLIEANVAGNVATYSYDKRGNTNQVIQGGNVIADYEFNFRNELTSATTNGLTSSYTYDADGWRVGQVMSDGVTTTTDTFVWDPTTRYGDVVYETSDDGTTTTTAAYTLIDGMAIGQRIDNATSRYYIHDALGSVRGLMDPNGDVQELYDYTGFGGFYETPSTTDDNPLYFAGQHYDDATDLYYMRARFYDPVIGRFLSQDPLPIQYSHPAEANRYGYAANNPVNLTDPSGYATLKEYVIRLKQQVATAHPLLKFLACALVGYIMDLVLKMMLAQVGVTGTAAEVGSFAAGAAIPCGVGGVGDDLGRGLDDAARAADNYVDDAVRAGDNYVDDAARGADNVADDAARNADNVADDAVDDAARGCNSFSGDTEVATAGGDIPISEIDVGDEVLAYNEATGETDSYTVVATIQHTDPVIGLLTIDGETLETTADHPFYTAEGEWVEAADLEIGDDIRTLDGDTGEVEAVLFLERTQPMYNLTVAEAHTFFVGDGQWLVHNSDPTKCVVPEDPNRRHHIFQKKHNWDRTGLSESDNIDLMEQIANDPANHVRTFPGRGGQGKTMIYEGQYQGHTIELRVYEYPNGDRIVSDGWVK